jgi:RNA polymerase sigma-70 factor (ECF subfamily)
MTPHLPTNPSEGEFLPTRKSLLTRLRNWDDQEGWREFFDIYWKFIYSVAVKAGLSDAEAQDVVQETVIAVARKMRRFHYDPAVGSFKAWLILNVRSRIADYLRKKSADKRPGEPLPGPETGTGLLERIPEASPGQFDAMWEQEWEKNLLDAALERVQSRISAKQFLIFDLYALKQVPVSTITRSLGVNAAQVYLAKHRVSRLLKAEVQKLERRTDP